MVIGGLRVALDCAASRNDGGWPPYGPPAQRGDGRNMLRPYGLARTYPSRTSYWQGSNCVDCQARVTGRGCQGVWSRSSAFRIVSSFRMQATKATFFALPAAQSRW